MKHLGRALSMLEETRKNNERLLQEHRLIAYKKSTDLLLVDNKIKSSISKVVVNAFSTDDNIEKTVDKLKSEHKRLIEIRKKLLLENNLPKDYLDIIYSCKNCKDYGYIDTEICSCVKTLIDNINNEENTSILSINNQTFDRFNFDFYSKVPNLRYKMSPFDNALKIFERCRDFADTFGEYPKNMLFSGGAGLGKTFLSTAIATEVRKKGFSVVYDTAINIFDVFESKKFSSYNENTSKKAYTYTDCDLLIIDDLGTELSTTFTTSVLYNIINTRLMAEKSTILSTNLNLTELSSKYTEAISSRLMGEFRLVYFFGDDIRKIRRT